MLGGLDPEEGELVGGVQVPDDGPGMGGQVGHHASILDCGRAVQG